MIETISHVFKVARIACDLDTEKLTEACPSCIIGYRCSRPVSRKSFTVWSHAKVIRRLFIQGKASQGRDLKIDVYGIRLTSDTLFAIKTKSLTVECFTYRIYSKYRKLHTETLCLTIETWRLIFFTSAFYNWTVRQTHSGSLQTSTRTSSDGYPKLLPLSVIMFRWSYKVS